MFGIIDFLFIALFLVAADIFYFKLIDWAMFLYFFIFSVGMPLFAIFAFLKFFFRVH